MAFATNLKKFRKRAGLTQAQLAMYIGVSPSTISTWEHSRKAPMCDSHTLWRLSSVLGCYSLELLSETQARVREKKKK